MTVYDIIYKLVGNVRVIICDFKYPDIAEGSLTVRDGKAIEVNLDTITYSEAKNLEVARIEIVGSKTLYLYVYEE